MVLYGPIVAQGTILAFCGHCGGSWGVSRRLGVGLQLACAAYARLGCTFYTTGLPLSPLLSGLGQAGIQVLPRSRGRETGRGLYVRSFRRFPLEYWGDGLQFVGCLLLPVEQICDIVWFTVDNPAWCCAFVWSGVFADFQKVLPGTPRGLSHVPLECFWRRYRTRRILLRMVCLVGLQKSSFRCHPAVAKSCSISRIRRLRLSRRNPVK